jgi:hypothetical protein
MQVLTSLDNGETWTPRPNAEPKVFAGFALPGDRQPDFIRQLTTQLQVETTLNVANDLTLNQEFPWTGPSSWICATSDPSFCPLECPS